MLMVADVVWRHRRHTTSAWQSLFGIEVLNVPRSVWYVASATPSAPLTSPAAGCT